MDHFKCDVLVVGSGAAGLRAAIAARERGSDVLLVSKAKPGKSSCTIVSGGVLAGSEPADGGRSHRDRTLQAGRGINRRKLVEVLVEDAPQRQRDLVRWGIRAEFHAGQLHCQGKPPLWGAEIVRCLVERNRRLQTRLIEGWIVIRLAVADGRVTGALAVEANSGRCAMISAAAVVLATGGAAALYRRHDNPKSMLGDGYRLALEAGAWLEDMEFVQFYPLALAEPGLPPFLIPPAFADYGRLVNHSGEDLLAKYGIDERPVAERARDRLSRALFREKYLNREEVWLDLRQMTEKQWCADPFTASVSQILGNRYAARQRPVRVAPVAHHTMGGVCIDEHGATAVPGLFAAGEVTGGLHGANRLGGNALSETQVFGNLAGNAAAAWAARHVLRQGKTPLPGEFGPDPAYPGNDTQGFSDLESLQQWMWEQGGILRDRRGLQDVCDRIVAGLKKLQSGAGRPYHRPSQQGFWASRLILEAALQRQESRGAHYRTDFPRSDDDRWRGHLKVRQAPDGEMYWKFDRTP